MWLKTTATGVCLGVFAECSRRSSDSEADWKQTPPSARAFILWQQELISNLAKRVEELEAKLGRNSSNSNRSPSSDSPCQKEKRESKGSGKPGAKKGHKGHQQGLLAPTETIPVPPKLCDCGCREFANVKPFYLHQHIELPEVPMQAKHFILQKGACTNCGKICQGTVPEGFQVAYGERLTALIGRIERKSTLQSQV